MIMNRFAGSALHRLPSISSRWILRNHQLRNSNVWLTHRRQVHQSKPLLSTEKVVKPVFIPFLSPPEDDHDYENYRRTTAKDIAPLTELPTRTKMLVRDFIDNSLYNPNYGYFSKQAVIFSPEQDFDFSQIRDHLHFMNLIAKKYKEIEGDVDEVDEVARQVWHTPTELFKPWYGYAIAKYLVTEYKLNLYPNKDLIIFEMGAGNGTLMLNILDYIQKYEPSVYKRTRYNIIEISQKLAERQYQRQGAEHRHHCVEIINKSIFDWDVDVEDDCFFVGMEVIDNFAHDLIRYDTETMQPYQALVSVDDEGNYNEIYEPVGSDPLIARYLQLRKSTMYRTPVLNHHLLQRIINMFPFTPNLSAPEFIPTKLLLLLETLNKRFPKHRLVLSDFSSLPNAVEGVDAPVVQTRYKGSMVPCSTYMVQPGWFDIFFPTNWELLRDMYLSICRGSRAGNDKTVKVLTHKDFCQRYSEIERTKTRSGENPMLMYYENVKMLLT
ncbi:S-adenosyl-L-methionine-dependent methyltransferase [Umbelopsis sp. PMI_123]|nr:S-adenosyl-L-methionine-dependent methyltransferase [Umbelopsis sp. PMI_123]